MSESLLFRRTCGGMVKVAPEALQQLVLFRQLEPASREAGGVLLGRRILGFQDVVIDEVTSPAPEDRRTRLGFHRSQGYHQNVIDARWRNSQGTCLYLGEWHTHPETCPIPSPVDLSDWRRRLQVDQFTGNSLLFIIVGTVWVNAWEGLRHSLAIGAMRGG